MSHTLLRRSCLICVTAVLLIGCSQPSGIPTAPSMLSSGPEGLQSRSSDRCLNVSFEGTTNVAFIEIAPGVFTLGGLPIPVTLGHVPGIMGSTVTSLSARGSEGQGAQHLTLQHTFESTDPANAGMFLTEDKAVCAPAGTDPNVCRVNDVLQIVSGTGIFDNAEGVLRNHGVLDLNTSVLTISLTGRVCGDGL